MLQRAHFPVRGQLGGPVLLPDAPATGTIGDMVTPPGASEPEGAEELLGVAAEVVGVAIVFSDSERDRPHAVIVRTARASARFFVIE